VYLKAPVQRHRRCGRQKRFSSFLKRKDEFMSWTEAVFETRGPATMNDRSPSAVCDLGTSSSATMFTIKYQK